MTANVNSSSNSSCSIILFRVQEDPMSYNFRAVAMSLIILVSLVGNVLVCIGAISRRSRPFSYYLIMNLAVAEILITVTQPFLFHYNTKPFSWVFGGFLCHLINPLLVCATSVVTFTLSTIAVYRCMVIIQPYRNRPSMRVTFLVIACSWIWSLAIAMPSAVTRKVTKYLLASCGILRCDEVFPTPEARYLYSRFLFALKFGVPLVIMVVSYGIVICRVKGHIHKARQESIEISDKSRTSTVGSSELNQFQLKNSEKHLLPPPEEAGPQIFDQENQGFKKHNGRRESSKKMMRLENDVLNMIYMIILAFVLCYLPYQILFVLTEKDVFGIEKWKYINIFYSYLNVLHALPSALHPILYSTMSNVVSIKMHCTCGTKHSF